MLTLSDINRLTNSYDGDVYSDLYKDVYGTRPRYVQFESVEEFDADYEALVNMLNRQQDEEKVRQEGNWREFMVCVAETMELCNCDKVRAVEIIAEAEGEADEYKWYGAERLEWHFNLKYGTLKQWLEA